jgi:hypothetical protein
MARTACLVCLISTVSDHSKKRKKTMLKIGTSRGHITNLEQSIFSFDIYGGNADKISKQVVFSVKEAFTLAKFF